MVSHIREVWMTLEDDVVQVGRVEITGKDVDIEQLRRAMKTQFKMEVPAQKLSIHLPDFSKGADSQGRYLTPKSQPLLLSEKVHGYLALEEEADANGVSNQLLVPGQTYETALIVSLIRSSGSSMDLLNWFESFTTAENEETSRPLSRAASGASIWLARDQLVKDIEELKLEREKDSLEKSCSHISGNKQIEQARELLLGLGVDLLSKSVELSHEIKREEEIQALATILASDSPWSCLQIGGNRINAKGAVAIANSLKENTHLRELHLHENWIDNEGAAALADMLRENKYLWELDLSENHIGPEGAKALALALQENKSLHELILRGNGIRGAGIRAFGLGLKENKFLQEVDFSANEIDGTSFVEFLRIIRLETQIKHLGVAENYLGNEGAKGLAEFILGGNKSLKTLKISACQIGSMGARELAEALRLDHHLTTLVLSGNPIGNEGAKSFAQTIKENYALHDLHLNLCQISDEGAKSLEMALKENKGLQFLDLSENKFSTTKKKRLVEAAAVNPKLDLQLE